LRKVIVDAIRELKYMIDEEPEESFENAKEMEDCIYAYNGLSIIQKRLIDCIPETEIERDDY